MKKYLQSIYAGIAISFMFLLAICFFIVASIITLVFAMIGQLQKTDIATVREDLEDVVFSPNHDIYGGQ